MSVEYQKNEYKSRDGYAEYRRRLGRKKELRTQLICTWYVKEGEQRILTGWKVVKGR